MDDGRQISVRSEPSRRLLWCEIKCIQDVWSVITRTLMTQDDTVSLCHAPEARLILNESVRLDFSSERYDAFDISVIAPDP